MTDEENEVLHVATIDGDEVVVRVRITDETQDEFLDALHQGKRMFASVDLAVAENEQEALSQLVNGEGERERFAKFVADRRTQAVEHSEIDQRAEASAIVMEHAREQALLEHGSDGGAPTTLDVLKAVLRYLDYQRAELHVERPQGEAGDMNWHVRLALANAGVSPEKALTTTLMMLADYQNDIYGQNAKIRRRLQELEAQVTLSRQDMLLMARQLEVAVKRLYPEWQELSVNADLREALNKVDFGATQGISVDFSGIDLTQGADYG